MSEQQQTEKSIFFVALEMSTVADRAAFLDQACAGNRALRAEVEALFAAHDGTQRLLDIPPIPPRRSCTSGHDGPGSVIGPYKLLDQIGEGGFGVVFMAEQTEPVRRRVALKILRPGMDTRQVVARFEAERQALAMMDHPNIARVFDGGATETGRPYFAMELVKGLPITEYCDRNRLSPRQRLELFMLVCQAVQHAHQKGIIHRDLKPTNVLVTSPDTPVPSHGREGLGGIPKIIDFGIAKALSAELTDKTLFTAFAQIVGTPLYMSPEQAGHNSTVGADIDTRSDIYSLGVLLYESLTGTTPFDKERFKKAAYDEIRNIIREEEPPRPSTRLSELDCAPAARRENGGTSTSTSRLATVAVNRQMEPARLSKLVRGDLDWIVMKAMEKDRNRRYETANGFVMDLQRYLADEPVLACPPSVGYRVRKFVKRSRRALAAIACFFVIVLAAVGAVAGTIGWAVRDRDAREAALAQEAGSAVRDAQRLMEEGHYSEAASALKRADALVPAGGNDLRDRVNELNLDLRMVARLEEIRLPRAVGGAEVSYDDAGGDAAYSQTFREYGIDVDRLSPAEAAAAIGRKVIRIELTVALDCWARRRRNIQSVDEHSWKGLIAVARAADPDEWRNQVRNALESRDSATLAALAASPRLESLPLQTLSLLGEAVQDATTSVAVLRVAQRRYPGDFWINFQLAWSLERLQPPRSIDAIRFYTAAKAVRPRVASIHVFLGNALSRRGDHDEAIAEYRKAVEIQPDYAAAHHNLGVSLHTRNRLDEAVESHRQALRHKPDFALSHLNLAMIANKRGQWDQAIVHATRVIELKGDEALALAHHGHALLGAGMWEMAAADLGTKSPSGPINDGWTKTACLLLLTGNAHGFRTMCKELSQRLESDQAGGPAYIAARVCSLSHESPIAVSQVVRWAELNVAAGKRQWNLHVLALALYRAGRFDEAIRRSEESLKMRADWNGNMLNWLVLAMAHQRLGRKDEAVQWMEKAANWRDKLPKGRDGNSHCPAALPVQDWLEFQVLLREAQPLVSGKTP